MKRKLLLCILVVLMLGSASAVFAQSSALNDWDCYFNPGNVTVSAGVGFGGFLYGFGLNLYPGIEVTFAKPKFGGVVPISFGVAARGLFGIYPGYLTYGTNFKAGVAGLGTVHLSLKGIDFNSDFLNMLDFYVGFGVSVLFLTPTYYTYYSPVPVAFASFQGVNYFFSDSFALYVESSYMGVYDYWLTVGALFKLGK